MIILTYAMLAATAALTLFLYGFFPIRYGDNAVATVSDIPDHVEHVRIKKEQLYKPIVQKVIVLVIDALRWDFITGPIGHAAMPTTNYLIKNSSACLMQARVSPPTVTMPRIKAMMTGSVPNFVDVAMNFGDLPVSQDSLMRQAKNLGHKLRFYGDDTWIKIFPNMFDRYEGTTSFFVNDFTEVDDNVTRHISDELRDKEDWSMLILHYLGLDHIGHVAGPFSPLIKPKLKEMDKIIGDIQKSVQSWNDKGLPALFIVCGDHGMKDSGGHGGSTVEETLVPFLTFGNRCPTKINEPNPMAQIDVAATLAVMLGIPIPTSNVGSVPIDMLNDLSDSTKLFILYYNSKQVFQHFKKIGGYESSQTYRYYKTAVKLHVDWLTGKEERIDINDMLISYNRALRNMKETLIHSTIEYNVHSMTIAMIFMVHIVYIMANGSSREASRTTKKLFWIVGSIGSYIILILLLEPKNNFPTVDNVKSIVFAAIVIGFVILNSNLCANSSQSLNIVNITKKIDFREWIFPMTMMAHVTSLTSSSFVEEEHQTWYFFWTTFLIVLLFDNASNRSNLRLTVKIIVILSINRLLRKLNSTGNKYAHLPDYANWLRDQDGNFFMTVFLLVALGLLVWIGYRCEEKKWRNTTLIMHIAVGICIYLRHMANGSVATFYVNSSRGTVEVRTFWIVLLLYTLHWTYRLCRLPARKIFVASLLRLIVQLWVAISAILHRPHNVALLPMQLICSFVVREALEKNSRNDNHVVYAYLWMGNVFYFYQGNSNSLATIDVAAGYVGLESYKPIVTAIFIAINTYSAPVLAYLTLVAFAIKREESYSYSERILSINQIYALWRFLPAAVFSIIVTVHRYHLFVWTVFSPKLVYEAAHCVVMFFVMILMQLIITVVRKNTR